MKFFEDMTLSHHPGSATELIDQIDEQSMVDPEQGNNVLKTLGVVTVAGLAIFGALKMKDKFFDIQTDVVRPGTTVVTPQETHVTLSLRREQASAPIGIEGQVRYEIKNRGPFGWGANVTCDVPYDGTSHGSVQTKISGVVKGDEGTFELDDDFTYDKPNIDIVLPKGGRSINDAYCDEGGLAELGSVFGDNTDPSKKSEAAMLAQLKKRMTSIFPYEADGEDDLVECAMTGNITREARVFNPDLRHISIKIGERGTFSEERCLQGTPEEIAAFKSGKLPPISVVLKQVTVEA